MWLCYLWSPVLIYTQFNLYLFLLSFHYPDVRTTSGRLISCCSNISANIILLGKFTWHKQISTAVAHLMEHLIIMALQYSNMKYWRLLNYWWSANNVCLHPLKITWDLPNVTWQLNVGQLGFAVRRLCMILWHYGHCSDESVKFVYYPNKLVN